MIFLFFFYSISFAYQDIDSLKNLLSITNDSTRYEILTSIADTYYFASELEKSSEYYKLAAEFAESQEVPNLRHVSESYGNYGYVLSDMGRYQEAILILQRAFDVANRNNDSTEIAAHYGNIGLAYYLLGAYDRSINNYQKALAIDKLMNIQESIGIDYSVIGNVFSAWGKHEKAKSFFRSALAIARQENNLEQMSKRLNKLGASSMELGQYDSAFIFFEESIEFAYKVQNKSLIASTLNQTGYAYQKSGHPHKAQNYFDEALLYLEGSSDVKTQAILYTNICRNYLILNDYIKAEEYCKKNLEYARGIGLIRTLMENYRLMSRIHLNTDRLASAYELHNQYDSCKELVFTQESQQKLAEFQVIFETDKKENEIKLLNSEKLLQQIQIKDAEQRFYYLILILSLFIILVGLLYFEYLHRKRLNSVLYEKNSQLQKLNATKDRFISIIAHDLKNPFTAFHNISSSLYKNRSNIAEAEKDRMIGSIHDASQKLKELLNSLLDWARLQKDNLNIDLEALNLKEIVATSIEYNSAISSAKNVILLNNVIDGTIVLSHNTSLLSILNNLITNAIKFSSLGQKVILSSLSSKNQVDLIVEDKGIGLTELEINQLFRIDIDTRSIGKSQEKGTGMGLILCKELVEKINGAIRVESSPGKGSKFIVTIPLISS